MRSFAFLCSVVVALFLASPSVLSLDRDAAHAIGRLNYAGYKTRQHCTAFLVAPKIAMTAAHCVDGLQPADIHLLLGYDRGNWREHFRVTGVWLSPNGDDLAALCLTHPANAAPLELHKLAAERDQKISIMGYGLPGVHRMSQKSCRVKAVSPGGSLLLNCPVTKGTSGGPVLSPELSAVFAVISATTKSESLAISVPQLDLEQLCS